MFASGYNSSIVRIEGDKNGHYEVIPATDGSVSVQRGNTTKIIYPEQVESHFQAEISLIQRERSVRNKAYALFAVAGSALAVEGVVNQAPADVIAGLATLAIVGVLAYRKNEVDDVEIGKREAVVEIFNDLQQEPFLPKS